MLGFGWWIVGTFPRARGGDPAPIVVDLPRPSLFPAHAGVILGRTFSGLGSPAFPRARGGDPDPGSTGNASYGFSPRTRG